MVIGDDQKLGVILSDDDTGTAACGLLGLRSLGTVTEHAEVVLYFLYGLVCDGDDRRHCVFRNRGNIHRSGGSGA